MLMYVYGVVFIACSLFENNTDGNMKIYLFHDFTVACFIVIVIRFRKIYCIFLFC